MDEIKKLVQALSSEDWQVFLAWVINDERTRRDNAPAVEQAKAEVIADLRQSGAVTAPAAATVPPSTAADVTKIPAWANPGTAHQKMYTKGQIVRHGGKIWVSEAGGLNHWEPGGAGVYSNVWRDITPAAPTSDGTTPDGSQANPMPFKAGLTLAKDQYVTYQGTTYKVLQAHTTQSGWNPPAVASLFQKA